MSSANFVVVKIPDHLSFDDLHLRMDAEDGTVEFDWAPLREIMEANDELTLSSEAAVFDLIGAWYSCLRLSGYRHKVAEECLTSCEAVREFGIGRMLPGSDTFH